MFDESSLLSKIVTVAVIGLLGWLAMTTQQLAVDMAVVNNNLKNLEITITTLSNKNEDIYTSKEADADKLIAQQRIERMESQLESVKERIRQLEIKKQ